MILAHGPLGYLLAALVLWRASAAHIVQHLTGRQKRLILWMGFFGGIFPDLDLLYYYPFDHDGGSHREYVSHAPIATIVASATLALIIWLVYKRRAHTKSKPHRAFYKLVWLAFTLGHASHILTDSLGNGVRWLYPSERLYGLAFLHPFFDKNWFLINFSVEMLCIGGWLLYIAIKRTRFTWSKISFAALAIATLLGGELLVGIIHQNAYKHHGPLYWDDTDNDGIVNHRDPDMDGDTLINTEDHDANGNGISNTDDIVAALEEMRGVWFDPLNGSFLNLFTRLGFFLHSDVVFKAYDAAGVFLIQEIRMEAARYPDLEWQGDLADPVDVRYAQNLFTLSRSRNWFIDPAAPQDDIIQPYGAIHIGDLAFIEDGRNVGVVSDLVHIADTEPHTQTPIVTLLVPTEEVMEYTIEDIESTIGPITQWARPRQNTH